MITLDALVQKSMAEGIPSAAFDDFLKYKHLSQDDAETQAILDIRSISATTRSIVTQGISAIEVAGWVSKSDRAARLLSGTASPGDIQALSIEAQQRGFGETPEGLSQLITAKAQRYAMLDSALAGSTSNAEAQAKVTPAQHIPLVISGFQSGVQQILAQAMQG